MDKQKDFWNIRARSFPGHREGDTYQAKMMEIMEKHGVNLNGASVLDLGCGSGAYTIRIAEKAKKVTALDLSEGMLDAVKKSAEERGLTNIEYVNADWEAYEPGDKFDLIFASLTPAVKDEASVDKMRKYAGRYIVSISFAGPMTAHVLDGLFKMHGIEKGNKSKLEPVVKDYLVKKDIRFSIYPVQGEWLTSRNREDMINNCRDVIEAHGVKPDMAKIEEYIERFYDKETNMYVSRTAYNVEMIVWEV